MTAESNDELQNLIERYKAARDSRLFAPLADAYRKSGKADKAIEILERGLERFPDYASAHVILGKCYYDKGASERAKAEFVRVIEIDPENMVALKFLGDILIAENKRAQAADYYRRVLAIDPTNAEVARTLKEMESVFPPKDIDLGDRSATRDERPREFASMTLAGIYAAQGYHNKALKIYAEVLQREPENKEAREMVSKLQAIMDSSVAERGAAFDEDVLTISVDDVSEDVAASTAGHGGSLEGDAAAPSAEEIRDAAARSGADREPPAEKAGAADAGARAPEEAEPTAEELRSGGPATGADIAHFQEWLKRLKKQ